MGRTTSGNYSFNYKKSLAFGYINSSTSLEDFKNKKIFVEIEKTKYPATFLTKALKDKNIKFG